VTEQSQTSRSLQDLLLEEIQINPEHECFEFIKYLNHRECLGYSNRGVYSGNVVPSTVRGISTFSHTVPSGATSGNEVHWVILEITKDFDFWIMTSNEITSPEEGQFRPLTALRMTIPTWINHGLEEKDKLKNIQTDSWTKTPTMILRRDVSLRLQTEEQYKVDFPYYKGAPCYQAEHLVEDPEKLVLRPEVQHDNRSFGPAITAESFNNAEHPQMPWDGAFWAGKNKALTEDNKWYYVSLMGEYPILDLPFSMPAEIDGKKITLPEGRFDISHSEFILMKIQWPEVDKRMTLISSVKEAKEQPMHQDSFMERL